MGDTISNCCDAKPYTSDFDRAPSRQLIDEEAARAIQLSSTTKDILEEARKQPYLHKQQDLTGEPRSFSIRKKQPKMGTSKDSDKNLDIFYSGNQFQQGKKLHGYGLVYVPMGIYFEGTFLKGQPTNGIFIKDDDHYYIGDIAQFVPEGKGKFVDLKKNAHYEGQWSKGLPHGQGTEELEKEIYTGNFVFGKKFGEGEIKFNDGREYKGQFYNGFCDGQGKLTLKDGSYYSGEWKLGKMEGTGLFKWTNGETYQGQYQNGVREGYGVYTSNKGVAYHGNWSKGKQNGPGSMKEGYDEISGFWKDGEKVSDWTGSTVN